MERLSRYDILAIILLCLYCAASLMVPDHVGPHEQAPFRNVQQLPKGITISAVDLGRRKLSVRLRGMMTCNNRGLPGALLSVYSSDGKHIASAVSERDGHYEMTFDVFCGRYYDIEACPPEGRYPEFCGKLVKRLYVCYSGIQGPSDVNFKFTNDTD